MSLVWVLAFFAGQFAITFAVVIGMMVVRFFEIGRVDASAATELVNNPPLLLLLGTSSVLVTVLAITALVLRRKFFRALALRRCSVTHLVLIFLMAPPLYGLVLQVALWVQPWLPSLGLLEELGKTVEQCPWGLVLLAGAIFPGFSEEILCRGFLGRGLVARWGVVLGSLFAACIFGLIHVEPVQICYAALIGILLQLVYLMSKSLLAPMLLHALNNSIAFLPSAQPHWFPGVHPHIEVWEKVDGAVPLPLLLSAVAAIATLLVVFYQTRVRWYLPDGRVWNPGYITAEMPPARVNAVARSGSPGFWSVLLAMMAYDAYAVLMAWEFYFKEALQGV